MKRLLQLLILCLAACFAQGLFACAEEWEEEAAAQPSAVTVQLPVRGAEVEIRAKEIGSETWLFLPAFADLQGLYPGASQGCFAQAWSVGELLRVFEALEK